MAYFKAGLKFACLCFLTTSNLQDAVNMLRADSKTGRHIILPEHHSVEQCIHQYTNRSHGTNRIIFDVWATDGLFLRSKR
jgi:hypothetical protein